MTRIQKARLVLTSLFLVLTIGLATIAMFGGEIDTWLFITYCVVISNLGLVFLVDQKPTPVRVYFNGHLDGTLLMMNAGREVRKFDDLYSAAIWWKTVGGGTRDFPPIYLDLNV